MGRQRKALRIISLIIILCLFIISIPSAALDNIIAITAYTLNVRQGPGTQYSIAGTLKYNSRWQFYTTSGRWLNIGTNRWIHGGYTKPSYPLRIAVTTAKSGLNVRVGPGTSYAIKMVLPGNTVVEVLEEKNGWLRIGNEVWISGYYTKALENKTYGWYYIARSDHQVPEVSRRVDISKYGGYYVGDTSEKKIYLTFDLGYEAGYTPSILDTLKTNDVKAVFFVAKYFIDENPELVKRMVDEGHIVGNHTNSHPSLPTKALDIAAFNREFTSTSDAYKKVTGQEMLHYMRPPMGEYSELSLYLTHRMGYKSFFWSFAYYDYDLNNQPDENEAFKKITGATHNGAIFLLHGVSRTNTRILDSVIKNIKEQGYQFCTIDAL